MGRAPQYLRSVGTGRLCPLSERTPGAVRPGAGSRRIHLCRRPGCSLSGRCPVAASRRSLRFFPGSPSKKPITVLQPNRRYAHSLGYIHRLARETNLHEVAVNSVKLRRQGEEHAAGLIIVLRGDGSPFDWAQRLGPGRDPGCQSCARLEPRRGGSHDFINDILAIAQPGYYHQASGSYRHLEPGQQGKLGFQRRRSKHRFSESMRFAGLFASVRFADRRNHDQSSAIDSSSIPCMNAAELLGKTKRDCLNHDPTARSCQSLEIFSSFHILLPKKMSSIQGSMNNLPADSF